MYDPKKQDEYHTEDIKLNRRLLFLMILLMIFLIILIAYSTYTQMNECKDELHRQMISIGIEPVREL